MQLIQLKIRKFTTISVYNYLFFQIEYNWNKIAVGGLYNTILYTVEPILFETHLTETLG